MKIYADKKDENKSQAVPNSLSTQKSNSKPTFQFVDNRSEAISQRKLQEMASKNLQAKQTSQLNTLPIQFMLRPSFPRFQLPVQPNILANIMRKFNERNAARELERQRRFAGIPDQRVARFHNEDDPAGLYPPVMRGNNRQVLPDAEERLQKRLEEFLSSSAGYQAYMVDGHATADPEYYPRSPLVSATNDVLGATNSSDSTNEGVQDIVNNAKHISVASVPNNVVHTPVGRQQKEEGELTVEGKALKTGVVRTGKNPWEGGILRLSRITPELLDVLVKK